MPNIKQIFKKNTNRLKNYVIMVVVDAKYYQKANMKLLQYLVTEQHQPGIYVSVNKPCMSIQEDLQKNKINQNLLIFIDCMTQSSETQQKRTKGCLIIGNPAHLSDISLAIDQAVHSIEQEEKFLYFDSLSTLMIYNEFNTVAQFSFYLTGKLREWKMKGIYLMLRSSMDKELINILTPFCDTRIDLKGD